MFVLGIGKEILFEGLKREGRDSLVRVIPFLLVCDRVVSVKRQESKVKGSLSWCE